MISVRYVHEIATMRDKLERNIEDHGWDCAVDAASKALSWVLGEPANLEKVMARTDSDRRHEWIARGGNPAHWPDRPQ